MTITGIKLRCALADCEALTVTAPSGGYTSGDMISVNDVTCVVAETVAAGKEVAAIFKAPKILVPCAAAATAGYAVGEKVYFDESEAEVTETASGNTLCGIVVEASEVGDEDVLIALDGMLGIVA